MVPVWFAFTGAGIVWLFSLLLPLTPAFAMEQRFSPEPRSGSTVALDLNRSETRFRRPAGTDLLELIRNRGVAVRNVYIPLSVQNLPADSMLLIDHAYARFTVGASSVEGTGTNLQLSRVADDAVHFAPIAVPAAWLTQHETQPAHVEMEYSITLVSVVSRYSL